MGSYIPYTGEERQAMLQAIGLTSTDQLFDVVPEAVRVKNLDLPDGLSDGEREVLLLFYQEGCTHQEMARRLGISEMNSRTRLFRAKNHCKKLLEKISRECHNFRC